LFVTIAWKRRRKKEKKEFFWGEGREGRRRIHNPVIIGIKISKAWKGRGKFAAVPILMIHYTIDLSCLAAFSLYSSTSEPPLSQYSRELAFNLGLAPRDRTLEVHEIG